jgi:hypothetical protein
MSRSFIHLRRALFGVSCTIVFGFGATQALAEPQGDRVSELNCRPFEELCVCEDGSQTCVHFTQPCPVC